MVVGAASSWWGALGVQAGGAMGDGIMMMVWVILAVEFAVLLPARDMTT